MAFWGTLEDIIEITVEESGTVVGGNFFFSNPQLSFQGSGSKAKYY